MTSFSRVYHDALRHGYDNYDAVEIANDRDQVMINLKHDLWIKGRKKVKDRERLPRSPQKQRVKKLSGASRACPKVGLSK